MKDVLIAPFSNSDIRDWPMPNYTRLIGLLLERLPEDVTIQLIGAQGQRLRANELVRPYPSTRVTNACGRLPWSEVVDQLRSALCIISNNSGLGHLGGYFGTPTVSVFGSSHPRHEWRPLGASVVLVSQVIGCSPCQLDHSTGSPYRKACLREIQPEAVAAAAMLAMARASERATAASRKPRGATAVVALP